MYPREDELATMEKLRVLQEAGAIRYAEVVGVAKGWQTFVQIGTGSRWLTSSRGQVPRVFKTLDAVLAMYRQLGITRVTVEQAGFRD